MLVEEIREEMLIPEGVSAEIEGRYLKVTGPKGSLERTFKYPFIQLRLVDGAILLKVDYPRKADKAAFFTIKSHINNMFTGVTQGYLFKMKVVYAHFPLNISIKGKEVIIDNYLGEKFPRKANIVGDVKVVLDGADITVEGINKEQVGQTAGNLEKSTRVNKRDPRVFQDGIYLVERNGVPIKW